MMDVKKDKVAELYRDFDEMEREELVEYLTGSRGYACRDDETLDALRAVAWTDYAAELGLEFHVDHLMQHGHGGYPYLYVVPADGGDGLCHLCATKDFKKGLVVGWSHHMEGENEYCGECSAEIKPFHEAKPESKLRSWAVTLKLKLKEGQGPEVFDWEEMLDLGAGESCQVEVRTNEGDGLDELVEAVEFVGRTSDEDVDDPDDEEELAVWNKARRTRG
jgi:hypothetical protein